MTPKVWFVVPAHGRVELARICLTQLRRTCGLLAANGIEASAVVIADDENLDTARDLGFATIERDNTFLTRKFNDGIQLALDPNLNPRPADYVVPCGSDDWLDYRILLNLPRPSQIKAFRQVAIVSEDGRRIATRDVTYTGGVGIRVYSRQLMKPLDYRPADEDRSRGCDTSILVNVTRAHRTPPIIEYGDLHPYQIVDWKTRGQQLNPYKAIAARFGGTHEPNPFKALAGKYPADALEQMRNHYARDLVPA
jgi:hypothetical protein